MMNQRSSYKLFSFTKNFVEVTSGNVGVESPSGEGYIFCIGLERINK